MKIEFEREEFKELMDEIAAIPGDYFSNGLSCLAEHIEPIFNKLKQKLDGEKNVTFSSIIR